MEDRQQDSFQNQEQNITKVQSFASADGGNPSARIKIWGNLSLHVFLIFMLGLISGLVVYRLIRSKISPIPPPITPLLVNATVTPVSTVIPTRSHIQESTSSVSLKDWRVYKDLLGQLMFLYPPDWKVLSECKFGTFCVGSPDYKEKLNNVGIGGGLYIVDEGGLFRVSYIERTPKMRLEESCRPGGPLYVRSCEETKLNGYPAMERIEGNPESAITIITFRNKYSYSIGMNYTSSDTAMKNILSQILSTFKFIEQDEVGETNNWNTYVYKSTSSKYPSYSIKYPAQWTFTEEFAHGTADLRVVFSDNQGKEVLSFIGSRLDFIDDFYSLQSNYLGQLKEVNIHGRKGYVFSNKYDYITAYYFPLDEGYVSFQLLDERAREIFEQMPATLSLSR